MTQEKQSEIIQFIPKELTDPRIQTISLRPLKAVLEKKEKEYQDTIKEYKAKIKQLTEELENTRKNYASIESLVMFRDLLSINCPQTGHTKTILQCAERIRKGDCRGCPARTTILEKLGAKPS